MGDMSVGELSKEIKGEHKSESSKGDEGSIKLIKTISDRLFSLRVEKRRSIALRSR